jgi:hypothetical protein
VRNDVGRESACHRRSPTTCESFVPCVYDVKQRCLALVADERVELRDRLSSQGYSRRRSLRFRSSTSDIRRRRTCSGSMICWQLGSRLFVGELLYITRMRNLQ